MKNVFFRSSWIYLLIIAVALVGFGYSASIASPDITAMTSPKKMKFKFEDYNVKSPEVVQAKLAQLFPKDSSVSEFQEFMERSGAKCYVNEDKGGSSMYCRKLAGNDLQFVKSQWVVSVKIGNGNSVNDLTVQGGLVGP
jgi:16S rRNA C967 or C1407 C5-methylase (RsmB/RsmF family)